MRRDLLSMLKGDVAGPAAVQGRRAEMRPSPLSGEGEAVGVRRPKAGRRCCRAMPGSRWSGAAPRRHCCGAASQRPVSEMAGGGSAPLPVQAAVALVQGVAGVPRSGLRA